MMWISAIRFERAIRIITAVITASCLGGVAVAQPGDASAIRIAKDVVQSATATTRAASGSVASPAESILPVVADATPAAGSGSHDCCCCAPCHAALPTVSTPLARVTAHNSIDRTTIVGPLNADLSVLLPPPERVA